MVKAAAATHYSPRHLGFPEGSGEGGGVEREELLTPLSSDHAPPCISLVHLFRPDSESVASKARWNYVTKLGQLFLVWS